MGISRPTAHKWIRRWRSEGDSGLIDRSSRPHTTPHRTTAATEARVCRLRQDRKLGPARLGLAATGPLPAALAVDGTTATAADPGVKSVHAAVDESAPVRLGTGDSAKPPASVPVARAVAEGRELFGQVRLVNARGTTVGVGDVTIEKVTQ